MAFGISKQRFSPIAIDFGADSLKMLQIIPGEPAQLVAAAAVVIPREARQSPSARVAFLGGALKHLLKAQEFRGKRAICSIPAFQTLVQHVELPRSDGTDPAQQLAMHLMERLQVDPNRLVIRTTEVGQRQRQGVPMREVLCLAASRDVVMNYIRIAEEAKIEVVGMHSEPPAIVKAFEHVYNRRATDQTEVRCFIDIGAATTKVVIARGHQMVFAKTINAAGDHLTRSYADAADIDLEQARAARHGGVPLPPGGVAPASESPTGRERRVNVIEHRDTGLAVLDALSNTTPPATPDQGDEPEQILIDELRLCLRHQQQLDPVNPVARLVFLGGEARNTALCQRIAKSVRVAAQVGDPFGRLVRIGGARHAPGVELEQPQPGWAVPYGLCHSEANL